MRELYVLMFNDLPHRRPIAENLENFRVERKRFSSTSATMSFPRLPREREFPSRDRRIAIIPINALPTYRVNAMILLQENERERERFEGEN